MMKNGSGPPNLLADQADTSVICAPATALVIAVEKLFGQALSWVIGSHFTVVDTVSSLASADEALERHQPDLSVIVTDPPLPDTPLREMCVRLIGRYPMTRTLLIFRERHRRELGDLAIACQQGARGLFDTTITAEQLVYYLKRLIDGEVAMQPEILRDIMQAPDQRTDLGSHPASLTAVQIRTLSLLADGYSSKEIARLMNVSTASVNHSLERAAQRLGAQHRAAAVASAFRLGVIR